MAELTRAKLTSYQWYSISPRQTQITLHFGSSFELRNLWRKRRLVAVLTPSHLSQYSILWREILTVLLLKEGDSNQRLERVATTNYLGFCLWVYFDTPTFTFGLCTHHTDHEIIFPF